MCKGSVFHDLRKQSAEFIASMDREGNAIGGLSVGEPHDMMYASTELVCGILPKDKPRYLMGVGTPENILECIALGIDMFDCVMPTRNARHGMLYTWGRHPQYQEPKVEARILPRSIRRERRTWIRLIRVLMCGTYLLVEKCSDHRLQVFTTSHFT